MNLLRSLRSAVSSCLYPVRRGFGTIAAATANGHAPDKRQRIVVLGTGWAGFKLVKGLDRAKYDVICVSPRNYFIFTPLLPSSTVGTVEYNCITESLRAHAPDTTYYQARALKLDAKNKTLVCKTSVEDEDHVGTEFAISFDRLVIAVGALGQTFNIPGVAEHATHLRDIPDAQRIRRKIYENFERASEPTVTSEQEKRQLLHVNIVGGGPTGIELAGELHDLVVEDLQRLYPTLAPLASLTVFDVAPRILPGFDATLADYAIRKFTRQGMEIRTGTKISRVEKDGLILESGEKVPHGLCVWSTGLKPNPFTDALDSQVFAKDKRGNLLVDSFCRLLDPQTRDPVPDIFAIGDCATIDGGPLPQTAQVANQEAIWLKSHLNGSTTKPFEFHNRGSLVYLGSWSSIMDLSPNLPQNSSFRGLRGFLAWTAWRSAYFTMSVSWRNKLLIPWYWFVTWVAGRDTSKYR